MYSEMSGVLLRFTHSYSRLGEQTSQLYYMAVNENGIFVPTNYYPYSLSDIRFQKLSEIFV